MGDKALALDSIRQQPTDMRLQTIIACQKYLTAIRRGWTKSNAAKPSCSRWPTGEWRQGWQNNLVAPGP